MAWTERLPSGRFRGMYRDQDRKKQSAGAFDLESEALVHAEIAERTHSRSLRRQLLKAQLIEVQSALADLDAEEASDGRLPLKRNRLDRVPTFAEYAEGYLDRRKGEISRESIMRYRGAVNALLPIFGETRMNMITKAMVQQWFGTLTGKPRTNNFTLTMLSTIANDAIRWTADHPAQTPIMVVNPCLGINRQTAERTQRKRLTIKAERELLAFTKDDRLMHDVITVGIDCGLRRSEILGLTADVINFDKLIMIVQQQIDRRGKLVRLTKDRRSGGGFRSRVVPITPRVARMLKRRAAEARLAGRELLFANPETGLGFRSDDREWNDRLRPILDAGLIFGMHDLRHTYATRMFARGAKPTEVQTLLGHSDLETTQGYNETTLSEADLDRLRSMAAGS